MSGVKGIRFRKDHGTRPRGDGAAALLHNKEHGNAPGAVQRAASPGNPAAVITRCRQQGTEVAA